MIAAAFFSSIVNSHRTSSGPDSGSHFFNVKPFTTATCCIPCVLLCRRLQQKGPTLSFDSPCLEPPQDSLGSVSTLLRVSNIKQRHVKAAKPGVLKLRALRVQKPWARFRASVLKFGHRSTFACAITTEHATRARLKSHTMPSCSCTSGDPAA